GVAQAVWMLGRLLEPHQVDDVDHAYGEVRQVAADQVGRGQRLQRGHFAGARQHDVGVASLVGARPVPDPEAARAVRYRVLHREVVEGRLLAGDDDVHVVPAAQAV